ncbi:MAG: VCBS repeat-containing protein, partial [Bacteroidota bacterium]
AVVTTTDVNGSYLYIWDLQTSTQINSTHTITTVLNPWYRSVSNATVADFDGDNLPEIGVCANYVFQVINDHNVSIAGTGGVVWSINTTDNSGLTGATAFDFNGDGINEVVYRDEDNLRIISGPSGVNLATFPCASITGGEYPIVVDIDNDNESEILCACSLSGYEGIGNLQAFRSTVYPWVPTRNIWNQYPYFIVNINNDMTVPVQQQLHHLVGSPPAGQTGRFNVFLKQVGPFDNNGDPIFPAADISADIISIDVTSCSAGDLSNVEVVVEFSNDGDLFFPVNSPFSFYFGNPETTGTYVATFNTNAALVPGGTITETINIDLSAYTSPFDLYVIGNDDGALPPPFDIDTDFPVTSIGECEFTNNEDFISLPPCETDPPVFTNVPPGGSSECGVAPTSGTPTVTDACDPSVDLTYVDGTPTDFCSGTLIRTWTATDDCGNTATATQTIAIIDTTDPTFDSTPSNISVDCGDTYTIPTLTASDACDPDVTVTFSDLMNSTCPGDTTITRTWLATDDCGNTSSVVQFINISDNTPPTFDNLPADVTVECDAIPDPSLVTASDDCSAVTVTYVDTPTTPSGGSIDNFSGTENEGIGTSVETFSFTLSGYGSLPATAIQDVSLEFRTRFGKGRAEIILIAPSGDAIVLVGEHCSTGNCVDGDNGFELYRPDFYRCSEGHSNYDNSNASGTGNFSPHGGSVTGYTGVSQYVDCFEDLTGLANGTWTFATFRSGSGGYQFRNWSVNFDTTLPTCVDPGAIVRTWTATDECGNTNTGYQTITLQDTNGPTFDSNPSPIADIDCNASIPTQETLTATDCGSTVAVTPSVDPYTPDVCNGYSITYRWTATDNCGNVAEVSETFDVLPDNQSPTFDSSPASMADIVCNQAFPTQETLTASDNCGSAAVVPSIDPYVVDECNGYTVTYRWTATDNCGNTSETTASFDVLPDNEAPVIMNVPNDVLMECIECLQSFENGSFEDNPVTGSWAGVLEDDLPAWSTAASDNRIEIQRSGSIDGVVSYDGNFHAELNHINNGDLYQEFCVIPTTILQISLAHRHRPNSGNTSADVMEVYIGEDLSSLQLQATISSNPGDDWAIHNINYSVPPGQVNAIFLFRALQGSPSNITIGNLIDDINILTLPGTTIIPTATDNCNPTIAVELEEVRTTNSCPDNFILTRTWTATDDCGNSSTASQQITVGDNSPPTFDSNPAALSDIDCSEAFPTLETLTASDNCGTPTVTSAIDPYVVDECAGYTVIYRWTATDDCSNTSEVTASFDVLPDTQDPVIRLRHTLSNGTNVQAGIESSVDQNFRTVTFPTPFTSTTPVVFAQVITQNGPEAVVTRIRNISSTGFQIQLQEEQGNNNSHVGEEVSWIAFDPGTQTTNFKYEVGNTGTSVTHNWFTLNFGQTYGANRVFLATMQTRQGGDRAGARYRNLTSGSVQLMSEEETSGDAEINHAAEDFGYIALEAPGNLLNNNGNIIGEAGNLSVAQPDGNTWYRVELQNAYNNPVVVMGPLSFNDAEPATIRVRSVSYNSFEYQIDEWDYLDGTHTTENLSYMVIEGSTLDDLTVSCDSIPVLPDLTVSDNCDTDITLNYNETSGTGCPYIITRTWTATDDCGNTASISQEITVADETGPAFDTPPTPISDIACDDPLPVQETLTVNDNCNSPTVLPSVDPYSVDVCNGYTITYRWTSRDVCGNVSVVTQSFNVLPDIDRPSFDSSPAPISDISCNDPLPSQQTLTASDGCGNATVLPSIDAYVVDNCAGYAVTYRWVATDDCGNTSEVTRTFNVLPDNQGPSFVGTPSAISDISCTDVLPTQETLTATDDCGSATVVSSVDIYTIDQCAGYTITYRWTATDDCGNV